MPLGLKFVHNNRFFTITEFYGVPFVSKLKMMLVFTIHAGICMLVFTIHAGIYDSCWYLWSAVCVKTQDDAGIYDSCWYLHFMLVFTIPA